MVEVKLFDNLDDVARDAAGALDRDRQPRLYDRLDWFARTEEHAPGGGPPLVARARNASGSAWLFLRRRGRNAAEALASWYTLEFALVRDGRGAGLEAALARGLGSLARLSLAPVAEPEPIARAFREQGWLVFVEPATRNWTVRAPGSFEDFWNARPGKLRSTVRRKRAKAGLDIVVHRGFDEAAWQDYRSVYARSWKPEEGSWAFMRAFAEAEGAAGALRLGIAYREGAPVAAQLWHVENGRATIHKLAYDEDARALSPGSILGEAMFRDVIEHDRPEVIDYGTGDEPYKADWMDEARPLWRIEMFNPRRPASWLPLARRALSGLVRRRASD